ncbi:MULTISPECIES: type VI secretion system-associated protein TagO [Pseudoalteromonas]|uniref:type VI secretion system-associated protein TagO n=1 Tax=Pseudoalteromonas TaxID=53246 RepID=UPI00026C9597|nr:type VI secretion system-associated protein TagO [Pseudoalteromonas spongiae]ATC99941.1 hypothetical protein PSPO_a3089 [Pseudoalteromonas spongiae UST010723-006]TMO86709.1 hypothetical protein CWC15_05745 [Pseudoalteromonas spongiae]
MKKLSIVLFSLLTLPLSAQEINTQALKACSFIENDFQRLQCYDQVVAGKELTAAKANNNKKAKPDSKRTSTNNENQAKPKKDNFGLEHKKLDKETDEITSVVVSVKKKPHGELMVTLENGHVWHQTGTEYFSVKEGETVIISRGLFNSFTMKVEGRNRGIKVKRK